MFKQLIAALSSMTYTYIDNFQGGIDDIRSILFIMENATFQYIVDKEYHKFHNGLFEGEDYPNLYNNITQLLRKR